MKARLFWLIPALGALVSCTMAMAPPPGDFNITVQGNPAVFAVNGMPRAQLTLTRGMTYTFSANTGSHPFYLTTHGTGGAGNSGPVTVGVSGAPTAMGTVTFTPDAAQAEPIYYQCTAHPNMGALIDLVP
jgi:hypothetical protein